jgi:hypothetical protein
MKIEDAWIPDNQEFYSILRVSINNVGFEMETFIGQNIQNKSNLVFKIQALMFIGFHPFFSQFFECLVKSLFIFGSKKFFNPNFHVRYRLKLFAMKELGHRMKQIVI